MKEISIPKSGGRFRKIVAPSKEEKFRLRELLPVLEKTYPVSHQAHGFVRGRSPVTNAKMHVGYACTIGCDFQDFFDHITAKNLQNLISARFYDEKDPANVELVKKGEPFALVLYKGRAAQGLPTSPIVANIAAIKFDQRIEAFLKRLTDEKGNEIVFSFTRYADDVSISLGRDGQFIQPEIIDKVIKQVEFEARKHGWSINSKKTHVQFASSGRRVICGISVGKDDIRTTREQRRRLRAAKNRWSYLPEKSKEERQAHKSIKGMEEWRKLKIPTDPREKARRAQEKAEKIEFELANKILGAYGRCAKMAPERKSIDPVKETIEISHNGCKEVFDIEITNSPLAFVVMGLNVNHFGCQNISCMHVQDGSYANGLAFWQRMAGVSLAIIWSTRTMKLDKTGTKVRLCRTRCLLYRTRDEKHQESGIYFGRFYVARGESNLAPKLAAWLKKRGFLPAHEGAGHLVDGNVTTDLPLPYFDNCDCEKKKAASGKPIFRVTLNSHDFNSDLTHSE